MTTAQVTSASEEAAEPPGHPAGRSTACTRVWHSFYYAGDMSGTGALYR